MTGRPRECECGHCYNCRKRDYNRQRYQRLSIDERRALVAKRDPELARLNDRARYDRDPQTILARNARYQAQHSERVHEIKHAWEKRNRDKRVANWAVNNAIRDGRLERGPCEVCGVEPAEAHHDDYGKPLDVRWLCTEHHGLTRRKPRRLEDAA